MRNDAEGMRRGRAPTLLAARVSLAALGLLGCESQTIVLGKGPSDGDADRVSSSESTVSSMPPSRSDLPSSDLSSSTDATGDFCDQVHATCLEETPGTMCQDLLINCRLALPDGGPVCDDVYAQCVALGYSDADCASAAAACDEGGRFEIIPAGSETL